MNPDSSKVVRQLGFFPMKTKCAIFQTKNISLACVAIGFLKFQHVVKIDQLIALTDF